MFLTVLTSVAISCVFTPLTYGHVESDASHVHKHKHHSPAKMDAMTPAAMIKEAEDRLAKLKDGGAALSPEMKSEFDYNMKVAAVEMDALKDEHIKDHKRHFSSLNRHLKAAEQIIKKHEHQVAHAKKVEERKAKAAERKARAEERKAKAAERKAARDAKKAKVKETEAEAKKVKDTKKEDKAVNPTSAPILDSEKDLEIHRDAGGGSDHGSADGGDMRAPGTEAAKPLT